MMNEINRELIRGLARAKRYGWRARYQAKELLLRGINKKDVVAVARSAIQSGPVRELAAICGRAGVAGAVVDGALGGASAIKALRDGRIDAKEAALHVSSEAGCGFVTSTAGTAGTLAAYMVTGSLGPGALVLGMGASMGSRWMYRKVVGETLPEGPTAASTEATEEPESGMEEIGPR
jgi:hypothetical protein